MQEYHLIPIDKKEHIRGADCWCKPTKNETADSVTWVHDVFRPIIEESTDLEGIVAFFNAATGESAHNEMLKLALGATTRVIVARENGKIFGMKAYAAVINPFIGKMGYAVLVDLSNGYDLEMLQ